MIDIEVFFKVQLADAVQTDVTFNGDIKVSREMTLKKKIDVYKCSDSSGFVVPKRIKIAKAIIAPDALSIISVVDDKGNSYDVHELSLDKNDAIFKYCSDLVEDGLSSIRKGFNAVLSQLKKSVK